MGIDPVHLSIVFVLNLMIGLLTPPVGLPRQTLYDVVSSGPIANGLFDFVKTYAIDGDPNKLAFSLANARKDVGNFVSMAEAAGFKSAIGSATHATLDAAVDAGFGDRYVTEAVDFFAKQDS